jgi:Cof subfamily protein (haloacid dehalogenase superfamily)
MIQLIVTDLDGTLLNDEKKLPSDFWTIEQELRRAGIVFAVASGRPFISMQEILKTIEDHVLFISENGSYVRYRNVEILCKAMNKSDVHDLIDLARKQDDTHILLCGKSQMYFESQNAEFLTESSKYYSHMKHVDDLKDVEDDILKFTLCDLIHAEKNCLPKFKFLEDKYSIAVSGKVWLDITDKGTNKGTAVEYMQKKLGIQPEATMVFGDYFNDIQMLENAGHSYAMKNAHPEIIKLTKNITEFDNNEGGVTKEIAKMIESMRVSGWIF